MATPGSRISAGVFRNPAASRAWCKTSNNTPSFTRRPPRASPRSANAEPPIRSKQNNVPAAQTASHGTAECAAISPAPAGSQAADTSTLGSITASGGSNNNTMAQAVTEGRNAALSTLAAASPPAAIKRPRSAMSGSSVFMARAAPVRIG